MTQAGAASAALRRGEITSVCLLERENALQRVSEVLDAVSRGGGMVLALEAAAGLGKTSLLRSACDRARMRELRVLTGAGSEFEGAAPYGLARELVEREVLQATAARRAELLAGPASASAPVFGLAESTEEWTVVHGLFWLVANLAQGRGVLLAVDDCQWSDEQSWRWLSYLARRLDGLPIGLIVAGRNDDLRPGQHRASELLPRDGVGVPVRLRPLSHSAVARLLRSVLDAPVDDAFVLRCNEATAGNPFLVVELAKALTDGVVDCDAMSIAGLGAVVPDTVSRWVSARLRRLGPDVQAAVEALAVLGVTERLSDIGKLSALSREQVSKAIDRLVRAEMITASRTVSLVHPLVRSAIYQAIPPGRRSELHRLAAHSAASAGAASDVVAGHLLNAFGESDPWTASQLLAAAKDAARRAAWTPAISYLRRALQEPPPAALRLQLLCELGLAEERVRDPSSVEHLSAALALTDDSQQSAVLARALARALGLEGRLPEAIDVLEEAIDRLSSTHRELALTLEGDIQAIGRTHPGTASRAETRLLTLLKENSDEVVSSALPGLIAQRAAWRATDHCSQTERLAKRALAAGELLRREGPEAPSFWTKVQALGWCDQYRDALEHADAGLQAAQQLGSITAYVLGSAYRAELHYRRGAVRACQVDAEAALAAIDEHRLEIPATLALAWLVKALLEQDLRADARNALADRTLQDSIPQHPIYAMVLHSRALLHLRGGDAKRARNDALSAGQLLTPLGHGPAPLSWRSTAAVATHALGRTEAALELAEEDLSLARRYGAPRALGIALRTRGVVDTSGANIRFLRQSVDVLERSEVRAEYARSLLELGSVVRRQRKVSESRAFLRQALDVAHQCGAMFTEQRARDELAATGAKPRRPRITGRDSLTPREQQVVDLVASGLTNIQVAHQLFLTVRTVETHLNRAYRKLGTTRTSLRDTTQQEHAAEPADRPDAVNTHSL